MRRIALIIICSSFLLLAACSKTEQANSNSATATSSNSSADAAKAPPETIVTASAAEVQIDPGGSAEAAVQVKIADGYHINGNPASPKYQIATTLNVEPGDGIDVGQPQYPPSMNKRFSFSPDPIAVYEGQATIRLSLRAAADIKKGTHTLRAKVRVQPCDDKACYPPRNIETTLPVAVK